MSQSMDILNHLKKKPITPIQALNKYGCFRLAARINDLRMKGHRIHTDMVDNGHSRYAQYSLLK